MNEIMFFLRAGWSAGSCVRQLRRAKGSGLGVRSDGKLRTHFGRDANWTPGLRIDGTPERARLRQELAVALAPNSVKRSNVS